MTYDSKTRAMAIIVPVWGAAFVDTYLNWCLPSQLTDGNLPSLRGTGSSLSIYTTARDRSVIKSHSSIHKASEYVDVRIHEMGEDLEALRKFVAAESCYRRGIRDALVGGMKWVAIVNPDAFFVGPVYSNQAEMVRQRKRALLCLRIRLDKDAFLEGVKGLPKTERQSPDALIELALRSLHPVSRSLDVRASSSNIWPSHLYYADAGVFVAKGYHLHPLIVAIDERLQEFDNMPEVSIVDAANITPDEIFSLTNSSSGFAFELSPQIHGIAATITPLPFNPYRVAEWQTRHCTSSQRLNFAQTFVLYPPALRSRVEAVRVAGERLFASVADAVRRANQRDALRASRQRGYLGRLADRMLARRDGAWGCVMRYLWRETLVLLAGRVRLADWKTLGDISSGFGNQELALECARRELANDFSAAAHFRVASLLFDLGRYQDSLPYFEQTIEIEPQWTGAYEVFGRCLWICGQWDKARRIWKYGLAEQARQAEAQGLSNADYRILNHVWSGWLGNNAHLDAYIKIRELGWQTKHRILMLASPERVANRCYLDYWSDFVEIVDEPEALAKREREDLYLGDSLHAMLICGEPNFYAHAIALAHQEWEKQGRAPLLKLKPDHEERGRNTLQELGVPRDAWFVCLHVRESGFWKEHQDPTNRTRVANVLDYASAIKIVVERGGWVIRMGDSSMTPLPEMPRVIDYAISSAKSDWMDVYLCAACRLLIGTNSALYHVSMSFGVHSVLTNWMPLTSSPLQSRDRFIPKLLRSRRDGRHLTFEEMLLQPRDIWTGKYFAREGLEAVDNTPDQIAEVVSEALDVGHDDTPSSGEDKALQQRYRKLLEKHEIYGLAPMGAAFLRAYRHLLP